MALYSELGKTGLEAWSGIIREDFLAELRGREGYRRFNEMRLNSPVVGAMLFAIEQAIRGVEWSITGESDDDPRVALCNDAMQAMSTSWEDHVIEALTFLPFGFAPFEIVYQRDGGRVLWRKFAIRSQDTLYRWELDESGGLAGMWQVTSPTYKPVLMPIERMLIYRTRVEKGNPEGRSILRTAWIPYYFWKNISQIEAIGIERDLAGLPMIELPEGASTDINNPNSDAAKADLVVRNIRNDEQAGVVLPVGWKLSLLSTGGARQFDTDAIVRRYESRILVSTLAQFLLLGQDKVGSLALSSDQTDFYNMSVNAIADIIADTVTKYAIPRLLALNGMDAQGVRMEHTLVGDVNLGSLGDFLQKIGDRITWTAPDEAWLRGVAKLPALTPEEIDAERTARRAEFEKIMTGASGEGPGPEDEEEGQDDMSAVFFRAGAAPDDDERRRWEKRYERLVNRFLAEQQARVVKGAKGLRRG